MAQPSYIQVIHEHPDLARIAAAQLLEEDKAGF